MPLFDIDELETNPKYLEPSVEPSVKRKWNEEFKKKILIDYKENGGQYYDGHCGSRKYCDLCQMRYCNGASDCLVMCYKNGFHWIDDNKELYDYLDRVSCKYCRNKNLSELKAIYKHFPKYWEQLHLMQEKTSLNYHKRYSIECLEKKFDNNINNNDKNQLNLFDFIEEE